MGMFDNVLVVNISNKLFDHNNVHFQTKSLDCVLGDYVIFNNQLWQQSDGEGERFDQAKPVDFTGDLNIYTDFTRSEKTYWVEYDISFEHGKLVDVALVANRLTKDCSDKSMLRPSPKSKSSCLTLNFRGVDNDIYNQFHANLNKNLDQLRTIVGDPKAEIVYQVRSPETGMLSHGSSARWLHSVVQSLSDFTAVSGGKRTMTDSSGNTLTVFVDEFYEIAGK